MACACDAEIALTTVLEPVLVSSLETDVVFWLLASDVLQHGRTQNCRLHILNCERFELCLQAWRLDEEGDWLGVSSSEEPIVATGIRSIIQLSIRAFYYQLVSSYP